MTKSPSPFFADVLANAAKILNDAEARGASEEELAALRRKLRILLGEDG